MHLLLLETASIPVIRKGMWTPLEFTLLETNLSTAVYQSCDPGKLLPP